MSLFTTHLTKERKILALFQEKHPLLCKSAVDAFLEIKHLAKFNKFRDNYLGREEPTKMTDVLTPTIKKKVTLKDLLVKNKERKANVENSRNETSNLDSDGTVNNVIPTPVQSAAGLSFKDKFKQIHKRNEAAANEKSKRSILYGSGLTKRVAEKAFSGQSTKEELEKATEIRDKMQDTTELEVVSMPLEDEQLLEKYPDPNREVITVPKQDNRLEHKLVAFDYDQSQEDALSGLRQQKYGILIGAAGTGKTTTIKRLITELETTVEVIEITRWKTGKHKDAEYAVQDADYKTEQAFSVAIAFAAYTGRAVQQMKRALPEKYHFNAMTIHRLLAFEPEFFDVIDEKTGNYKQTMTFKPRYNRYNKLPHQIIIIDEAGMVPIPLWNQLIDACTDETRIILIGDINQLPPVQGRSVLGYAMSKWPTYELTTIHRQARDNPIITNAHKVLKGMFPSKFNKQFDILTLPNGGIQANALVVAAIKKLHQGGAFNELTDAVIVPQNSEILGQEYLNSQLVNYFNQPKPTDGVILNKRETIVGGMTHYHYAVGDKVMLLQNDNTRNLTNGMIGVVVKIEFNSAFSAEKSSMAAIVDRDDHDAKIDFGELASELDLNIHKQEEKAKEESIDEKNQRPASHIMTVKFDDKEVDFSASGHYNIIRHAYAFTCHKSQGGEYPVVIIVVHSTNSVMLCREWFYTAMTRAQKRVILLCNDRGLAMAVNRQRVKGTSLKEKIEAFIKWEIENNITRKGDRNVIPNLPIAMEV